MQVVQLEVAPRLRRVCGDRMPICVGGEGIALDAAHCAGEHVCGRVCWHVPPLRHSVIVLGLALRDCGSLRRAPIARVR